MEITKPILPDELVCYTAIFSHYEELKHPKVITPNCRYICFTDQPLTSEVWEIIQAPLPLDVDPVRLARYYKIMEWVDWKRSIWVDGSFVIDTDLNIWWDKYFRLGLSAPAHPLRNDWFEECMDCIVSHRGDRIEVDKQMNEYKALGLPRYNGIIQSGILMRENTEEVITLCEAWWKEMTTRSSRDQIAFAKVSLGSNIVNMYQFDYRMGREFIYHKHFKNR